MQSQRGWFLCNSEPSARAAGSVPGDPGDSNLLFKDCLAPTPEDPTAMWLKDWAHWYKSRARRILAALGMWSVSCSEKLEMH